MVNRRAKEPRVRAWGRMRRLAVWAVAVILVCAFGAIVTHHGRTDAQPATDETGRAAARDGDAGSEGDAWKGLRAAGIPTPGEWSRPEYTVQLVRDGALTDKLAKTDGKAKTARMPAGTGAVDAALATMDALLDATTDDKTWAARVADTMGADGAGVTYALPNFPRHWALDRRFDPNTLCTGDIRIMRSWTSYCKAGEYQGDDHGALGAAGRYQKGETRFAVPAGFSYDSRTDPQEILARQYDTVVIPMDDGPWHITVYCPARTDDWRHVVTDLDGDETDPARIGDGEVVRSAGGTGFGTRQHPCRTIDVSVGGQTPYWYVGEGA